MNVARSRFRGRAVLAAAVVVALVAAGCGDDDSSTAEPPPDTTAAGAATTAAGSSSSAAGATTAAPGGGDEVVNADTTRRLRLIGTNGPQHMDPATTVFPCETEMLRWVYDGLIRQNAAGELVPGLAESWDSPDPNTFVLHLRSGVKFQDGTDFNADAVKQHIERGINAPTSTISDVLSEIESVETPDDLTVVLHLASPRAGVLPTVFSERAGQVPSPTAVAAAGDSYGADEAVGAGPYVYDGHTPSTDIHVSAWDGYWDADHRYLAGIDMLGSAEEFQIERITSGEVDYASMKDVQLPEAEAAKAAGDIDFRISSTDQYAEIYINWSLAPFDDVRVRQALNMAIDRELLVEALTNGSATPATSPVPTSSWAYAPETADLYPYDPERAKELLAEAGYPEGVDVTVGMIEHPYYSQLAQAVQDMVAESGFRFSLETVTGSEINNRLYEVKNLPVAITAFRGSSDPGVTLEQKFSSAGNSNPAATTADGVDDLLAAGAASSDQDERAGSYQAAQLLIMQEALSVPIFHNGGLVAFSPEVKGVQKGYTTCQFGSFVNDPIYFEAA